MPLITWYQVPIFILISAVSAFKIEFGYGTKSGRFEVLQPPAVFSPTDNDCHDITNLLAPNENVDFVRVQNRSPGDGDPPGIIAFYASDEACRDSDPIYISWFKSTQNTIQAIAPYWTIVHMGSLEGDWTLGKTGYPEPKSWRNIPRRGISPEIGIVRATKLRPGDVVMLFDEGWAVDSGGVALEGNAREDSQTSQILNDINIVPPRKPSFQTKEEDRTEIVLYPDGTGKIFMPDGPVVDIRADGTSVAHQDGPDGFVAEFNPQTGALVQDNNGRNIHLDLEDLEGIQALEAAGIFDSPTRFNEIMSGLQSSLFTPNADRYDALSQINGDFVADLGSPTDQNNSKATQAPFPKVKRLVNTIGSQIKAGYNWVRNTCKRRARGSIRSTSPVSPHCTNADIMTEDGHSPFPTNNPSIGSVGRAQSGRGQQVFKVTRFQQDESSSVSSPSGGEMTPKESFVPSDNDEILESPYFARIDGNDFTFQDDGDEAAHDGILQQNVDMEEFQGQINNYPMGILNILNRKKGTSEFTFKGDMGTQTMEDIYEGDPAASLPRGRDTGEKGGI
ncbi:hypothetical protein TWF730_004533 [Orbilia blumenaviensis]|uniref:Uncharacterized protein n=1 Tax=Orbilia blumenaviensis TaxID=1796055 RepID=A0AAV9U1Z1_9PEZI